MENEDLKKVIQAGESELKNFIVDYVGEKTNPENNEVTVERIVEVFAEEFPEFLLALAEENWISGYTQALNDVEFVTPKVRRKIHETEGIEEIHEDEG